MKKLIAILVVLLCVFSLAAEWGRIQYIDEFGDVDPTISDPYQIVDGTREEYGRTTWGYDFRFLACLPTEFGLSASIQINIFDDFGDYVVFANGGEAKIRVKLESGDIKEFTYDFNSFDDLLFLFNEYEIESMKQNIYLNGSDAVDLLNELYKGNDLKFVIYYENIKYNFTIEAVGFREISDGFIDNFSVPLEPDIFDDGFSLGVSYYFAKATDGIDYVLGLHSSGVPEIEEYPSLSLSLAFKNAGNVFWYDNDEDYIFQNVQLVSSGGNGVLSLTDNIENDEYGSYFGVYETTDIQEIIDFANLHGSVDLIVKFEPSLEFSIPLTAEEILELFSFPER